LTEVSVIFFSHCNIPDLLLP